MQNNARGLLKIIVLCNFSSKTRLYTIFYGIDTHFSWQINGGGLKIVGVSRGTLKNCAISNCSRPPKLVFVKGPKQTCFCFIKF